MTSLDASTTFLIMRLKLEIPELQLQEFLCELVGITHKQSFMKAVLDKFRKNQHLINVLGSWIGCGPSEELTRYDILELFDEKNILKFSGQLNCPQPILIAIFSELLPFLVKRYVRRDEDAKTLLYSIQAIEDSKLCN